MKLNISYLGTMDFFHVRRDLMLAIKYGLEDCGHDVSLNIGRVESDRLNILIGAYWLDTKSASDFMGSGIPYIHINTEIISNDMLNHRPEKCDFLGSYVPFMKNAKAAWDLIPQNIGEYLKYDFAAHFMPWGYVPQLKEIQHKEKDLDFYFFGSLTQRRNEVLMKMAKSGLKGLVDQSCPYFLRNDRIARAKVQLNLVQSDKYTHVTSTRTCYLANNDCFTVSEPEHDLVGYLDSCSVVDSDNLVSFIWENKEKWKQKGEENCASFKTRLMKDHMLKLLDESL